MTLLLNRGRDIATGQEIRSQETEKQLKKQTKKRDESRKSFILTFLSYITCVRTEDSEPVIEGDEEIVFVWSISVSGIRDDRELVFCFLFVSFLFFPWMTSHYDSLGVGQDNLRLTTRSGESLLSP